MPPSLRASRTFADNLAALPTRDSTRIAHTTHPEMVHYTMSHTNGTSAGTCENPLNQNP